MKRDSRPASADASAAPPTRRLLRCCTRHTCRCRTRHCRWRIATCARPHHPRRLLLILRPVRATAQRRDGPGSASGLETAFIVTMEEGGSHSLSGGSEELDEDTARMDVDSTPGAGGRCYPSDELLTLSQQAVQLRTSTALAWPLSQCLRSVVAVLRHATAGRCGAAPCM